MATEVAKKRGRPRKAVVVELEMPEVRATNSPAPKVTKKSIKKTDSKGGTRKKSNESSEQTSSQPIQQTSPQTGLTQISAIHPSPKVQIKSTSKPPPLAVLKKIAIKESKILRDLAAVKAEDRRTTDQKPAARVESGSHTHTIALPIIAVGCEPTDTSMPTPIPSQQSSSLLSSPPQHFYQWLSNPSTLQTQTAFMSTKSKPSTSSPTASDKKIPLKPFGSVSPKALNKFVVEELSSRRGPGSGAEKTRADQVKAEALPKAKANLRPGELPKEYKGAARRVTAIMVALPIAIVTSYYLYQRLVLGVEKKTFVRLPPDPPTSTNLNMNTSNADSPPIQ